MPAARVNPELLIPQRLRRWLAGVSVALIAAVAVVNFSRGEPPQNPPPESMANKYPPRKTEDAKPAPPTEPDPRQHNCPWLDEIFDDEELATDASNREEYHAYNLFVQFARNFTPEQMAKVTRKELTWRMLFGKERAKYRGEIARVEGRLKRLVDIGSNRELENQGIKKLYEAWIFDPEKYFSNPTCVILSELPPGLEPADDFKEPVHVVADGYFFKRYKYRAVNDTRLAPLVIGRTLTVAPPATVAEDPGAAAFGRLFVPTVLALALAMVVSAYALHRWYGQGDQVIHQRLESARFGDEFVAPIERPGEAPQAPEPREFF